MKRYKQQLKYGVALAAMSALPAIAMANGDLNAEALTQGITGAKTVIIAVATAIFGLVGLLVAIRYAKRAAS